MAHSHAGGTYGATDFAQGAPNTTSPLSHSGQQIQVGELGTEQRGYSLTDNGTSGDVHRSNSTMSQSHTLTPSRGGTLKKKQSLSKKGSLKRGNSRRNSHAGSVRSLAFAEDANAQGGEMNSAFYTPVPTSGNPTEILANRFQAWRKVLKDLITYFRDIQKSYDTRSKSLYTLSNVINNIVTPPMFLTEGGISDATHILRNHHKQAISEGNKAKTIEEDVVVQLTGLRSDLQQKIKEIKSLSGDFKNNVDKETESTRRAVRDLQEALGIAETESTSGKGDPFIVKLGVERQLERQIEEENYLHRAFLNLESSGRELESIVVGEIQKAYNAYAAIITREADEAYEAVEKLRSGPIAMAKDHEWSAFVEDNDHFVNPRLPVRRVENISYPGRDDPAASEVRAGMLERKSKYLKSYTAGWYVLSPTHLHEFKSPDNITSQAPLMSLNLTEQKLGSHSTTDSSSHKFMLKGRQSGGMHRGHAWVFRAESHDTMLAWFEDIKNLTEKTGEERTAFIRRHARSVSGESNKAGSISSDGAMDEDEADQVPYSATDSLVEQPTRKEEKVPERPNPGGRFPSALNINRDSQVPLSPSSPSSSDDRDTVAAAGALSGSYGPTGHLANQSQGQVDDMYEQTDPATLLQPDAYQSTEYTQEYYGSQNATTSTGAQHSEMPMRPQGPNSGATEYNTEAVQAQGISSDGPGAVSYGMPRGRQQQQSSGRTAPFPQQLDRHDSMYGDWMGPAAAGAGRATVGTASIEAYKHPQQPEQSKSESQPAPQPTEPTYITHQATPEPTQALPLQNAATHEHSDLATTSISPTSAAPASISTSRGNRGLSTPTQPDNQNTPITNPTGTSYTASAFTTDPAAPIKELADTELKRPGLESHASVATISDLHIPGEFPRGER